MYTIEELERVIDGWNAAVTRDGDETTEDSAVIETINFMGKLTLARQLLDTMRALEAAQARITELETFGDAAMLLEHAQMKARIEAAAAIAANAAATGAIIDMFYEKGWDECRAEFRAALELEGE